MLESRIQLDANKLQSIALELQVAAQKYSSDEDILAHSKYLQMFQEINSSNFSIYNVAGGFCLEVFVALGIVTSIDDCELDAVDPQEVYDAIYGGLYTAITSVSPTLLQHMANTREKYVAKPHTDDDVMSSLTNIEYLHDLTKTVVELR